MRALVTGGAGFIGSTLVDRLLAAGHTVVAYDNFSTGQRAFLNTALQHSNFHLIEADVLDPASMASAVEGCDVVFHLAANADVRFGLEHPDRDLRQNTVATYTVLEAMRTARVSRIVFASTGSVYGEPTLFPTPENAPFPIQTSLYGASKLAGEALITAYSEGFGIEAYVFRFVSILGERYTHGHVFDFCKSLLHDPSRLSVLGNGRQRKSYLYVQDCVDAILMVLSKARDRVTVLNLGTDEFCEVNDSIRWITERMGVSPYLEYSGGDRGWVGDNPFIFLDCSRVRSFGWQPTLAIRDSVIRTVDYLLANQHILHTRI